MLLLCLIEKIVLKFVFEKKGVFLKKIHFYLKRSMEISGKGFLQFYQQASSLIGNQTNHRTSMFLPNYSNSCYESDYECICIVINGKRTSMFLPYYSNSCYESDYECICIVINGKIRSVPLNIFSSV